MRKTLLTIGAMFLSISIIAQTNDVKIIKPSFSVEGGYVDRIFRKGVAYTSVPSEYVGLRLFSPSENNFVPVDIYGGGTFLVKNTESFWNAGVGKDISLNGSDKYKLRFDSVYTTRWTTAVDVPENSDVITSVAFVNPFVTPYVSYTVDWKLKQNGFTVGLTRDINVEIKGDQWFRLTPNVAYHIFEDYESLDASARLSIVRFRQFTPFVEGRYVDNAFNRSTFNWATYQASGDVTWLAGLSVNF